MKCCPGCGETDPALFVRRRWCVHCLRAERRAQYAADEDWQRRQRHATLLQRSARLGVPCCTLDEFVTLTQLPLGCPYCGYVMTELSEAHLDHTVPLAQGGDSMAHNLRLVCQWCNRAKGHDEAAFYAWIERLRCPF